VRRCLTCIDIDLKTINATDDRFQSN